MSAVIIIPKRTKKNHREKLILKKCAFPGCKIKQKMTACARYCTEHRQRKYRKLIDAVKIAAKKAEEEARNPNQTIKHNYTSPICIMMKCKLDGCNKEFEIKILPSIYIYPRYCQDHRNDFKRALFIKNRQKIQNVL